MRKKNSDEIREIFYIKYIFEFKARQWRLTNRKVCQRKVNIRLNNNYNCNKNSSANDMTNF